MDTNWFLESEKQNRNECLLQLKQLQSNLSIAILSENSGEIDSILSMMKDINFKMRTSESVIRGINSVKEW